MGKIIVLVAVLFLGGCTATPAPTIDPVSIWCDHNQPRRPTVAEVAAMTVDAKREAVAHNRKGVAWCGWGA